MKLRGEPKRAKAPKAREFLEAAAAQEPLPFDPERDITPKQKELMLRHVSTHDQYLLALGLNAFLFPNEEKAKEDPLAFMYREEQMRPNEALSKKTGRQLTDSLRSVMVGETEAALWPFSLLDILPEEFKHPIAGQLWAEVQKTRTLGIEENPIYSLMVAIGAEKLLPEKRDEVQAYKDLLRERISVERIMGKLQFRKERDYANWELLELALVALCFPDLQNQIHLDEEFWNNIRAEMKMYTESYESLYLSEVAFSAAILAKIPQQKMMDQKPLPQRLVA